MATTSSPSPSLAQQQLGFAGIVPSFSPSLLEQQQQQQFWLKEPLTRDEVLAREVPWDGYLRGGIISQAEVDMLKAYDKKDVHTKSEIMNTNGQEYMQLLFPLLMKVSTLDNMQYIIALINEAIEVDPDHRISLIRHLQVDPYVPLLNILARAEPDWFLTKESCLIITRLMAKDELHVRAADSVLKWLCSQLCKENPVDVRLAVTTLMKLAVRQELRLEFAKLNGLSLLTEVIQKHLSLVKYQLLYECIFCIWLLCYSSDVVAMVPPATIKVLVEVLRQIQKEKVQRVCVAAFRNMLKHTPNLLQMIGSSLHKIVTLMLSRKWGDTEIIEDLQEIDNALQKQLTEMSSFDVYKHEVMSGNLEWSPVHMSEKFWRENVLRFEENKFELLGQLHEVLQRGTDPVVIAVACHDLGEFVHYHPRGRSLINQMDVKVDLMKLLANPNPEVQKHALFSLQKMMAHKWDYGGV
eukprot:TRINITY_DN17201_c0_g1_i1.p1 TRINITY_DN17201_c0_g1~~TRINITY_DN17201_c0_g1_i1.p1  ORF type:complete len:484 (+),score=186.80 TRINITY_DN17201_c0_g1_i1:57-1454(+)